MPRADGTADPAWEDFGSDEKMALVEDTSAADRHARALDQTRAFVWTASPERLDEYRHRIDENFAKLGVKR